jgi:hypothetical protein
VIVSQTRTYLDKDDGYQLIARGGLAEKAPMTDESQPTRAGVPYARHWPSCGTYLSTGLGAAIFAGRLTERLLLAAAEQMVADFRARAILTSLQPDTAAVKKMCSKVLLLRPNCLN